MIVYSETKAKFHDDVMTNDIGCDTLVGQNEVTRKASCEAEESSCRKMAHRRAKKMFQDCKIMSVVHCIHQLG